MSLTCLSNLATDVLALVTHALALVGLRLADLADVGRGLSHDLLVNALNRELCGVLDGEGDSLRGVDDHRV